MPSTQKNIDNVMDRILSDVQTMCLCSSTGDLEWGLLTPGASSAFQPSYPLSQCLLYRWSASKPSSCLCICI